MAAGERPEAVPSKWQVKREASYEALVRAANRCFHERGYAATRVEDIVAGTRYSKGAFYFHFQNKLDCLWHVVAYRDSRRGEWWTLPRDREPGDSSLEQLLRESFARFAEAEEGLSDWVLVMVDLHQQHRDDEGVQARAAAAYASWVGEITAFVESLQAGGWVAAERDPSRLARQAYAYVQGLTVHARLYGLSPSDHERALFDGLLAMLR